jgi:transcription antitermination factor NusG
MCLGEPSMTMANYYLQDRGSIAEEQLFYDHFLALVEQEHPEQLIDRVRVLFIDGIGYPQEQIVQALARLVSSKQAAQAFFPVLNRCLHILINRWQLNPRHKSWIPQLIYLFEDRPVHKVGSIHRSRLLGRLHQLIAEFAASDQYLALHRFAQVIERSSVTETDLKSKPLELLIPRYPYLYDHCLMADLGDIDHQHTVQRLKQEQQQKFEQDLAGYVAYEMRRNRLIRRGVNTADQLDQMLGHSPNPTLLTGSEVANGLKFYMGKVQGNASHKDIANRFSTHTESVRNFGQFKEELYVYITTSMDPGYAKRHFNAQFSDYLINFLPDHNSVPLTEFLVVRTCSQVLNYLVVESPRRVEHFTFIDLLGNLGPMITTGVLLRVVLFCKKVKPYLEKRLGILFNHYGKTTSGNVLWLVKSLENMNLALSSNFGSLSLPFSL